MLAAVEDKFESEDMKLHHEDIFKWLNELWNKYRWKLNATYVKGKPIHEALKNVPKGVDKNEWEWLVKEHFSSDDFQERSIRSSKNRAKLTMLHRTGSKPIRQIIYDKGGKDGNPPNLGTVFFESHKKDGELVDPEAIEKYARIEEVIKSDPSMPCIEVVEQCFGPQKCSHVVGFGGGLTAKDLKGGTSSKAELLIENKSLRDRVSILEEYAKEFKEFKETQLARQCNAQPSTSPDSENELDL